jgi:hypothetical protein
MMIDSAISELLVENFITRRRPDANDHGAPAAASRPPRRSVISRPSTRATGDAARTPTHRWPNIASKIFIAAVVLVLWIGWLNRDDNGLTPVSGVGYWLGIAGSSLMLLLLLYPLRKRVRSLRGIGPVTFWFRTHMILGVLGPVLVLWHANFSFGSINCSVALVTMLVVAISGIIGRYLHSKINLRMHGRKAEAREVEADADELRGFIGTDPQVADRIIAQLDDFAQLGTAAPKGVLGGLVLLSVIGWRGSVVRMRLIAHARQVIAVEGKRRRRSRQVQNLQLAGVTDFVTQHIGAAKRAATFAFYERLFRLWHVFHVPLFVLLVIVAIIHVFASHFF